MHMHLLHCRAICCDLTVYVLSYIYFWGNIHPQALGSICYVMNPSSSQQSKDSNYFSKFLEISNQRDPIKTKPKHGGKSSERRPMSQAVMSCEMNVSNS